MLNEQLMEEMRQRARHSSLFQNWWNQVIAGIDDDEVVNLTMRLCCSLHDVANAYHDKLLKIMQERIVLSHIPSRPTGVAESMSQLHEMAATQQQPKSFPNEWDSLWPKQPTANPNPDLAFQHPNNLPPFPTEED